jgi:hypothetical protein
VPKVGKHDVVALARSRRVERDRARLTAQRILNAGQRSGPRAREGWEPEEALFAITRRDRAKGRLARHDQRSLDGSLQIGGVHAKLVDAALKPLTDLDLFP